MVETFIRFFACLFFFFCNLIGRTGVHSAILQEIEERRQLEEPL